MSETEAGASWQPHYVWDAPYPHHQNNIYPSHHQYEPPYNQASIPEASRSFSPIPHQNEMKAVQQGVLPQTQSQSQQQQQQQQHHHQQQQQQEHHHHCHHHHTNPLQLPSHSWPTSLPLLIPPHPQHQRQQKQQQHQYQHRMQVNVSRQNPYDTTQGDPMITSSLKGKQSKDGPDEKKDADGELWGNVEAQAAFLGPNLWDKTLPYDADLKYVDLDEFLSENGIPVDGVGGGPPGTMQGQLHKISNSNEAASHQGPAGLHLEPVTKRERSPSPSDCCSPDTLNPPSPADSTLSMASSGRDFDPRTRAFSDEELKPQPMIKKSRKQVNKTIEFVPDDLKDDKYWARRRKNNMAAKRSRDARRMKENQIALRAGFLEKENMGLRQEIDRLKNENMLLRDKLSKYTDV